VKTYKNSEMNNVHSVVESKSLSLKIPNQTTLKALDDVEKKDGIKKFNNMQEMLDDLHADE
jgi:hypothetical protein